MISVVPKKCSPGTIIGATCRGHSSTRDGVWSRLRCDAERFDRGQIDNKIELGGPFDWKVGRLRAAQDLPGLLAWHIILVLAQPRRKRDPYSPMGEAPALGEIVEDHLGRVLVGDS